MAYKKSKVKRIIEQELREFFGKKRQDKWESIAGTITGDPEPKAVSGLGEEEVRRAITKAAPLEFHGGIQNMLTQNILKILSRDASGLLEGQPQPLGGVPPRADAGPIAAKRGQDPSSVGSPTATVTLKAEEVFARLNNVPPETQSAFLTSLAQILNSQFGEHIRFAAEEQAAPAEAEAAPAEKPIRLTPDMRIGSSSTDVMNQLTKLYGDIQAGSLDGMIKQYARSGPAAAQEFVDDLLGQVAQRGGRNEKEAAGLRDVEEKFLLQVQGRLNSLGAAAPEAAAAAPPEEASPWKRAELHGLGSPGAAAPRELVKPASLHGLGSGPGRSPATPGPGMRREIPGGKAAPAAAGKPKRPASSRRRGARLAKLKGFEPLDQGPGSKGAVSSEAILDLDLEAEDENLLGDFLRDRGYEITEAQIKRMKEIAGIE